MPFNCLLKLDNEIKIENSLDIVSNLSQIEKAGAGDGGKSG